MAYILKNTSGLVNTRVTDVGRQKLSQGNFKISYFQIGDSEVSYDKLPSTYNQSNSFILEPQFNSQNASGIPESNKQYVKYPYFADSNQSNTYGIPFMDSVIDSAFNRAPLRGFFTGNTTATTINWDVLIGDKYSLSANYIVDMSTLFGTNQIELVYSGCNTINYYKPQIGDIITIYYDGEANKNCGCVNLPKPTPTPTGTTTTTSTTTTTTLIPCLSPTPTPTPSKTPCLTPTPSPQCPLPPAPECYMPLKSCYNILTYKIIDVCQVGAVAKVTLDRPTPDFSNFQLECYSRVVIYPSKMTQLYDSITPMPHWGEQVIDFESICDTDQFDVKIWNMNIPWTENPAGLIPNQFEDYTKFGSINYIGSKEYFGYNSSSGQTDTSMTFYYNSFGEIVQVKPEEQKAIAIIHYTNQTIDFFYGEKFALKPYDPTNPTDTTGQARNFKLHIPWIMWHKNPSCCFGQTFWVDPPGFEDKELFRVHHIKSKKNEDMNQPGIRYYHLWDTNPNVDGIPNRVGKVFPDSKLIIIDDEELIAAMSYKSNRNWTLPAPQLSLITPNTCDTTTSSIGILTGDSETMFITYRLSNKFGYTNSLHCNYYPYIIGNNNECNPDVSKNVAVRFGGEFNCLIQPTSDTTTTTTTISPTTTTTTTTSATTTTTTLFPSVVRSFNKCGEIPCSEEIVEYGPESDVDQIVNDWYRFSNCADYLYFSSTGATSIRTGLQNDGSVLSGSPTSFFFTGSPLYLGAFNIPMTEGQNSGPQPASILIKDKFYFNTYLNKFVFVSNVIGAGSTGFLWTTFNPTENLGTNLGNPSATQYLTTSSNWTTSGLSSTQLTVSGSNNTVVYASDKILDAGGNPKMISCIRNSAWVNGFYSPCEYENYTHEVTLGSTFNDDDFIGIVLATKKGLGVNPEINDNLCLVFNNQPFPIARVDVVYNYGQGTYAFDGGTTRSSLVMSGATSPFNGGIVYKNQGQVRVKIIKNGTNFDIYTTNKMNPSTSGSTKPYYLLYSFDVSDPNTWNAKPSYATGNELLKFSGGTRLGYLTASQPSTFFYDVLLTASQNTSNVLYTDSQNSVVLGDVYRFDEVDGCWTYSGVTLNYSTLTPLTVSDSYIDCDDCANNIPIGLMGLKSKNKGFSQTYGTPFNSTTYSSQSIVCPVCESPSGFYGDTFQILAQKVPTGQRPDPTQWRLIDVTSQISNNFINGYITQSSLTGTTFIISPDNYNSAPFYNLNNYIPLIPNNTIGPKLNFGDEYYFYGALETDIEATIYEMKYKINLSSSEFQVSTNPSWKSGTKSYVTEIALLDDNKDVLVMSKLQSPTLRQGIQQYVVKIDF